MRFNEAVAPKVALTRVVTLSPGPHLLVVPRGLHEPHPGGDGPGVNACLSASAPFYAGAAEQSRQSG